MGIAFVAAFGAGASGCFLPKKVKDVPDDIRQCFGPDVKGAIGDLVNGIETALVCELSSGGQALPACVIEGLQTVAEEIGPSGKADVQCVIDKIAKDAAARVGKTGLTPEEVVRDQRAKLLSERGVFLSWNQLSPDEHEWIMGAARDVQRMRRIGAGDAQALATCDTYCGARHGTPVPGGGCECWRGDVAR